MSGNWTTIQSQNGDSFDVYLSLPESRKGPGIVLLHEIFGVNDYIKQLADLYATEGFVVAAPNIYWHEGQRVALQDTAEGLATALEYHDRLDVDRAARDVAHTAEVLRNHSGVTGKVGAVGFCLGGRLAYLAAVRSKLDAAVSYYGPYIERYLDEASKLSCPMMIHCATEDQYVPTSAVDSIRGAFARRDDVNIYLYPGVDHGFNRLGGAQYDWKASMIAHSRTMYLFRTYLGTAGT